ncbi:hypothetical protein T265_00835 [Opisthorchis viverrini]|uniref:CSN12-like protein n=1 Tax=Opisthorchis viverrini TaxID=6198 RepID=A0A075A0V6_OPIVI|nr:hypothetical protein T265_00835 [Opisthorchis viverrini]KER33348.1 hypothetical protein T265_00835 [Opisthorchis viverrini]
MVMKHVSAPWDEAFSAHMRFDMNTFFTSLQMRLGDAKAGFRGGVCLSSSACEISFSLCQPPISTSPPKFSLRNRYFFCNSIIQLITLDTTVSRILTEIKEENWMLPVVLATAIDLRRFAHGLDAKAVSNTNQLGRGHGRHMETAAQLILRLFQICASDSRTQMDDSKKLGMMGLANQLFKIYFQINKLNLCKPMIRAIENMNINDRFSLAQRVTYSYYVGRKAMFDGDFVSVIQGVFPYPSLLVKYNLNEFLGISDAAKYDYSISSPLSSHCRAGNLQKMDMELNKYEEFFLSCGVYLILEKLKLITYRNLFKKVCAIMKTHLMPIEVFTAALRLMGVEDIDQDETECILANLIYEGKIKGYLAHQQQKLVVSKLQAFPALTAAMTTMTR